MQYNTYSTANNSHNILNADDCQNVDCYDEFKALEKTAADNEKNIKDAKEKYRLALIDNLRCDLALEKMAQKRIEIRYIGFTDQFPIETIHEFRAIKNAKDDDYKFVLAAIRGLHKGNLDSLQLKFVNGQLMDKCDLIEPAKMNIIEAVYNERLKYINECELIDDSRKKLFKQHIKQAVSKINNTLKDDSSELMNTE